MATGVVKWFNNKKGFGFIAQDNGGRDVFVHFSTIEGDGYKSLEEGDRVEFNLEDSERGPKATSVKRI